MKPACSLLTTPSNSRGDLILLTTFLCFFNASARATMECPISSRRRPRSRSVSRGHGRVRVRDRTNQSRGRSRAPAPPQLENTESSTSSLIDVDSPHVSSVPSDYQSQSVKTSTQAERMEVRLLHDRQLSSTTHVLHSTKKKTSSAKQMN